MSAEFNPALLLLVRQFRRASQAEVARKAGLNQGHYSRIENGLVPEGPSADSVEGIANALSFPANFFYQSDGLSGLPLSVHPFNRRKSVVRERALKQIHAELNIRLIHLRRFLRAADVQPELPLPRIDVDEGGGPQEIARIVRRSWSIPDGPISDLTGYCERAGILVIWCDLESGVDGVTMTVRDLPPCIFLNRNSPPDRMRFSLAHELGHIIMHAVPTDTIEEEANAFAGELLVPEKQFRRGAIGQRVNLEWLARQKAYWKVSMALLLYRAGALDVLTRHQSEYLWKKLSARKRIFHMSSHQSFPD
jgi:Zn-dependent peptidase ImmA (M78 family)/transcriptional regulator with XRE-family HTH domain